MYDAYPYQKFGIARGEVRTVAAVAQRPDEIGITTESPELLYRVRVAPDASTVQAFGREQVSRSSRGGAARDRPARRRIADCRALSAVAGRRLRRARARGEADV